MFLNRTCPQRLSPQQGEVKCSQQEYGYNAK
nr:MAG TPA: hypothetical protein [Bacteriophage sp.]